MRTFFDNIPGFINIVDADFRIISTSREMLDLFDIPDASAAIGQTCYSALWNLDAPCPQCSLAECFSTKHPVVRYSTTTEESRFKGRSLQIFSGPILDDEGEVIGGMTYSADISDLRAMERQLIAAREAAEAANAAKSEFLARMSHEIRTPMNAILGFNELLLMDDIQGEAREYLQISQTSARHLLALINDILDLSKIEARHLELFEADFDIQQALEAMLATMRVQAQRKGLELDLELTPEVPQYLRGDVHRLNQILINLIGNAIKFSDRGVVSVRCQRLHGPESDRIRLGFAVADNGEGIPEEMRQRIFDAFAQIDGSDSRSHGGTGLGLAICRQLVEMMGGDIQVSSRPGQGSVFSFNVLLTLGAPDGLAPAVESPAPMPGETPQSWRILLVEDLPVNVIVAEQFLARLEHRAKVAADGWQALERLGQEDFDLVLMDIEMPGMNGFETTQCIRAGSAGDQNRDLPVIGLTAHALNAYRDRGAAAGMNGYIHKPIGLAELDATIRRVMAGSTRIAPPPESPSIALDAIPVIDLALPMERFGDDANLLFEILAIMLEELPGKFARLADALEAAELDRAVLVAHAIKSHLGTIGADSAMKQAAVVENALLEKQTEQARDALGQLGDQLARLYDELPAILRDLPDDGENASRTSAIAEMLLGMDADWGKTRAV